MRKEKLEELKILMNLYKVKEIKNEHQEGDGFIKIIQADYVLNIGKTINRERITKGNENGSCSIILPVLENGDLVFVVQPRVFTENEATVEAPAGMIENNEEAEEAARRELEEETGCVSDNIVKVMSGYGDPGSFSGITNLFIAFNSKRVKELCLDEDEYLSTFTCTYEEALELVQMGYICDMNTRIIVNKLQEYKEYFGKN